MKIAGKGKAKALRRNLRGFSFAKSEKGNQSKKGNKKRKE